MKFTLDSSRYCVFLSLIVYLATLSLLLFLPLPHTIVLLLFIAWGTNFFMTLRQHVFLTNPHSIRQFWLKEEKNWQLQSVQGAVMDVNLCHDSICSSCFILLNFKALGACRKISVLIFPDSMPTDKFRQLNVLLRTEIKP